MPRVVSSLRCFRTARKQIPDDKQKLEFKVRLKYKSNEKCQRLVTKSPEAKSSLLLGLIRNEVDPLMDKVNELLELDPEEGKLFLKYRAAEGQEMFIMDCERHGEVRH